MPAWSAFVVYVRNDERAGARRWPGTRINYPPMMFFVAKGAADECGPGCDTWIAAFGEIDSGAAARFQRFLDKLGKTDLPIFIQSPGGLTVRATTMGDCCVRAN